MRTDFDFPKAELVGPVVFRPEFNTNAGKLNTNQAWSLFFTAGQEDKALDGTRELGRFFTNTIVAIGLAGTLWAVIFSNVIY
jgi:hypothetical protein